MTRAPRAALALLVFCGVVGGEARGQTTTSSVAEEPYGPTPRIPGINDPVVPQDAPGLDLGRELLRVPGGFVELLFSPVLLLAITLERYAVVERLLDIFTNDERTFALLPIIEPFSQSGLGFGALAAWNEPLGSPDRLVVLGLGRINGDFDVAVDVGRRLPFVRGRAASARVAASVNNDAQYFGLGSRPDANTETLLRIDSVDVEASLTLLSPEVPVLTAEAGLAYRRRRITSGEGDFAPSFEPGIVVGGEALPAPPGFGETLDYPEAQIQFGIDTRNSFGLTSRGILLLTEGILTHDVNGSNTGGFRINGDFAGFVPLLLRHRVLYLRAGAGGVLRMSGAQEAPFHLLPSLGGASRLRGYADNRFVDQLAWWATAEYRWFFYEYSGTGGGLVGTLFLTRERSAHRSRSSCKVTCHGRSASACASSRASSCSDGSRWASRPRAFKSALESETCCDRPSTSFVPAASSGRFRPGRSDLLVRDVLQLEEAPTRHVHLPCSETHLASETTEPTTLGSRLLSRGQRHPPVLRRPQPQQLHSSGTCARPQRLRAGGGLDVVHQPNHAKATHARRGSAGPKYDRWPCAWPVDGSRRKGRRSHTRLRGHGQRRASFPREAGSPRLPGARLGGRDHHYEAPLRRWVSRTRELRSDLRTRSPRPVGHGHHQRPLRFDHPSDSRGPERHLVEREPIPGWLDPRVVQPNHRWCSSRSKLLYWDPPRRPQRPHSAPATSILARLARDLCVAQQHGRPPRAIPSTSSSRARRIPDSASCSTTCWISATRWAHRAPNPSTSPRATSRSSTSRR
ncbi:MAG: BamA/TamA family outer membrane protein [Myxococcales bacterium]|nr:BamA/TamA family outer membrane protein [Myxococcales bacterium]